MKPARWDDRNKRWEAVFGSGKSRKRFCSRVEGEAGKAEAERKRDMFVKGPKRPRPGSLAEFVQDVWWPRLEHRSKNTRIKYHSVLDNHLRPLCPMQMGDLRLPVLQSFVNGLPGQPKTVVSVYGVLRSILHLAYKSGAIGNMDYELVVLPEVPKKAKPVLDDDQGAKLIEAAKGTSMEGPIWAIFYLALRPGEICGLKVPHIAFVGEDAVVTLQDNRQHWGEAEKLKNKRKGEVRVLTVPRWMGEKLLSFAQPGALYVFSTQLGKPIQPARFGKQIHQLCEKAGVPDIQFKNLRHSCSTNLRNALVPESVISDILGHASINTSMTYIQTQQEQIKDGIGRLASRGGRG